LTKDEGAKRLGIVSAALNAADVEVGQLPTGWCVIFMLYPAGTAISELHRVDHFWSVLG
jgi:hypothetical protein